MGDQEISNYNIKSQVLPSLINKRPLQTEESDTFIETWAKDKK